MAPKSLLVVALAIVATGAGCRSFAAQLPSDPQEAAPGSGQVETGIDVLEEEHFVLLRGMAATHGGTLRIGLVTDQAGVDAQGRRTIDVLAKDAEAEVPGLHLTKLFGPEHGIGSAQDSTNIQNSRDAATGLPVFSLYGATDAQRRPDAEQLAGLDAILIDLQDVGVHFYTYETVVGYFLEAAKRADIEIVILDRPNPINGVAVQGPVSTPGRENYINYIASPVRQGLTMGELARYDNGENHLGARLTVVRVKGWRRSEWFDQTGLMWIDPSPNLRSLTEAILYPGIGELERTNLSVGRGTDTPFERIGAPWIDARRLAQFLSARSIPGVRFVPVSFTPGAPYPYAGQLCQGIEMMVVDRDRLDAPELGMEIAAALLRLFPHDYDASRIDALILNQATVQQLERGTDPRSIAASWQPDLRAYEQRRARYLLY